MFRKQRAVGVAAPFQLNQGFKSAPSVILRRFVGQKVLLVALVFTEQPCEI